MSATALPQSTRRWPRYKVDLPVRIIAINGILTTPVMGRGSDISRAGMALDAKVGLNPGDLMRLQFPTAEPSCVNAIVRHRHGNRLGLEFLSQLPPDDDTKRELKSLKSAPAQQPTVPLKAVQAACTPKGLYEGLKRKQEEFRQLKKEIELLSVAILLLAEDENEISGVAIPASLKAAHRPWPQA